MPLFSKQPIFCANCGKSFDGYPDLKRPPFCGNTCRYAFDYKYACMIVGKEHDADKLAASVAKRIEEQNT